PVTTTAPIGCFADQSTRDLPTKLWSNSTNTPTACIAGCQKAGFAYAGVQYTSECWCGNSYGRYGTSTNCTMTCSGDSTQICGGAWANDVEAVNGAARVNGACGAANGVATATAPPTGLCNAGTASAVTGSGPFSWTCTGSGGGASASCSAPLLQAPPPPP